MDETKEAKFRYKLGETVLVPARIVSVHQSLYGYEDPLYVVNIHGGNYSFYEKTLKKANLEEVKEKMEKEDKRPKDIEKIIM